MWTSMGASLLREIGNTGARLVLVALLLGFALTPYPEEPASASCAGPYFEEQTEALERGAAATITGKAFADGCQDDGSCPALGCGPCDYGPPPRPEQDVALQLLQRGHTWDLGVADAGTAADNKLGAIEWVVDVPEDAKPGPARLKAGLAEIVVELR